MLTEASFDSLLRMEQALIRQLKATREELNRRTGKASTLPAKLPSNVVNFTDAAARLADRQPRAGA